MKISSKVTVPDTFQPTQIIIDIETKDELLSLLCLFDVSQSAIMDKLNKNRYLVNGAINTIKLWDHIKGLCNKFNLNSDYN